MYPKKSGMAIHFAGNFDTAVIDGAILLATKPKTAYGVIEQSDSHTGTMFKP